jgi:subtilisin family serine protease
MKRFAALLLLLAFASSVFATRSAVSQSGQDSTKPRYAAGQILVKLRAEARPSALEVQTSDASQLAEMILPETGARADSLDGNADQESGLYVVQLAEDVSVDEALRRAASDPRVAYAEPDYLITTMVTPNDSLFNEMWGLSNSGVPFGKAGADIGATNAWDLTTGSEDVVVAITDTGSDLTHPDLAANAWVNSREIPGNSVDDDANGLIDDINGWNFLGNNNQLVEDPFTDLHGTHVAGTIGAVGNNGVGTTGVAWRVKLMSLKFLGSTPGTSSNAIKCINYAAEQRRRGVNVRVINASWGGASASQSLREAISAAGNVGIVFVCAAGNGGSDFVSDDIDVDPDFPAAWSKDVSSIITVAALDRFDSYWSSSNYGHTSVTVAAPGVSILSTTPAGGYQLRTGTSMSTPHVSGTVALLAAYNPSLTPAEIRERIIRTAVPVLSTASKTVAAGRANAFNALTNQVAPPGSPAIRAVRTNKKFVFVDGLNFVSGSSVIEVNGVPLRKNKFDDTFKIANGTLTQVKAKLGKAGVQSTFPQFTQVSVTVFNQATSERSAPINFTRF